MPPSFSEELVKELKSVVSKYMLNFWFGSDEVRKIGVTQMFREFRALLVGKFLLENNNNNNNKYNYHKNNNNNNEYNNEARLDIDVQEARYLMLVCHEFNIILILMNVLTEQQYNDLGEQGWHFPFSSNIFFEVWEDSQQSYYVKMRFNDREIALQKCLKEEQERKCSLDNFIGLLDEIIVNDLENICTNDN